MNTSEETQTPDEEKVLLVAEMIYEVILDEEDDE